MFGGISRGFRAFVNSPTFFLVVVFFLGEIICERCLGFLLLLSSIARMEYCVNEILPSAMKV